MRGSCNGTTAFFVMLIVLVFSLLQGIIVFILFYLYKGAFKRKLYGTY